MNEDERIDTLARDIADASEETPSGQRPSETSLRAYRAGEHDEVLERRLASDPDARAALMEMAGIDTSPPPELRSRVLSAAPATIRRRTRWLVAATITAVAVLLLNQMTGESPAPFDEGAFAALTFEVSLSGQASVRSSPSESPLAQPDTRVVIDIEARETPTMALDFALFHVSGERAIRVSDVAVEANYGAARMTFYPRVLGRDISGPQRLRVAVSPAGHMPDALPITGAGSNANVKTFEHVLHVDVATPLAQ